MLKKLKYHSRYMIEDYPHLIKYFASVNPLHLFASILPVILLLNFIITQTNELFSIPYFVLGLILWSFAEYAIHRWLYHTRFQNKFLAYFLGSFHLYHHAHIEDTRVLNSNLVMLMILLVPMFSLTLFGLLSLAKTASLAIGFICFYYFYECTHYLIHYREYESGFLKFIQRYHLYHHDHSPLQNFGNTSALWDIILVSYQKNYKTYKLSDRVKANFITSQKAQSEMGRPVFEKQNDFQYLLLGGIAGELLELPFVGDYLHINKRILNKMGIPYHQVKVKTLSSRKSSLDNAHELIQILRRNYKDTGKKTILIAHSKACMETLLCLITHTEEFTEYVEKVINSQPPFQGSSLLSDQYKNLHHRMAAFILKGINQALPGLNSLRPQYYDKIVQTIYSNKLVLDFLESRMLVIRGYRSQKNDVSWVIKYSHFLLNFRSKRNDGLLTSQDQILPLVDYTELVLDIDHSDLFTSNLLSNKSNIWREKMMKQLIEWCLREEEPALQSDKNLGTPNLTLIPGGQDSQNTSSSL